MATIRTTRGDRSRLTIPHLSLLQAVGSFAIAAGMPNSAEGANLNADLVITGGTIYNGSSNRGYIGDVVVTGDRILFVGAAARNPFKSRRVINAKGMVVAPGFIDPHTHTDSFLTAADKRTRLNLPWMMQGVTTIFTGVDGYGQPSGKVDISGLFSMIEQKKFGSNVAAYVGFAAVRRAVIGNNDRAPTSDELRRMQSLVVKGMCEGALGFSAGLFYAPQSFARTDEVIALAKEAAKRGGIYDTHQRDESSYTIGVVGSTKEAIAIGRAAGMPVHIAHLKALGVDVQGKAPELVTIINAARAEGVVVTADQYPWEASRTRLSAALLPRWSVDGRRSAMLKRFADPAQLLKIRTEMRENLRRRGGAESLLLTDRGHPWTAKRLSEVAREWNVEPVDVAIRILLESEDGDAIVSFNMAESDIKLLMKQPWIVTSSDGSVGHPRMYASFPRKYAKYVLKDRVISLAEFINSSTGRTADTFGLKGRGHLRKGAFADVVVFDPKTYRPKSDYIRPDVLGEGIRTLLVNGAVAVDGGKPTGIAAGRPIKHVPTAGTCS